MRNQNATPGEKAYRGDTQNVNHSALRVFNVCPNLYNEQYITKTYEEPEKDYFLYGSVVDCLLTSPDDFAKRFVRVDSRLDPSDALKYEQKIRDLEAEMILEDKKGASMVEKAKNGNKTAQSGIEKRERDIEELRTRLMKIKELGTKQQVTNAMWEDAHATADAIRSNPLFKSLTFNDFTSQQMFVDLESSRKGILDHVSFDDPTVQNLYEMYKTKLIDLSELQKHIDEISAEREIGGSITDVKTTKLISEFEPEMYAVQLSIYQHLVNAVTHVKCRCYIIAGDKDPSCKRSQDYELSQRLLDEGWERYLQVEAAFRQCKDSGTWPSAKELWGTKQKCFRCSVCRDRPFSTSGPLLVNGPLF